MIQRTTNPRDRHWPDYGGRGIGVCVRLRTDFIAFFAELMDRPRGHTLDRIDNDGGYWCGSPLCPECGPACRPCNIRWADRRTQNRNRRNCRTVTLGGRTQTLAAWIEELGLPASTVHSRLRLGWSSERALTTPARRKSIGANQASAGSDDERRPTRQSELSAPVRDNG
jgi:hypothetical protein